MGLHHRGDGRAEGIADDPFRPNCPLRRGSGPAPQEGPGGQDQAHDETGHKAELEGFLDGQADFGDATEELPEDLVSKDRQRDGHDEAQNDGGRASGQQGRAGEEP